MVAKIKMKKEKIIIIFFHRTVLSTIKKNKNVMAKILIKFDLSPIIKDTKVKKTLELKDAQAYLQTKSQMKGKLEGEE